VFVGTWDLKTDDSRRRLNINIQLELQEVWFSRGSAVDEFARAALVAFGGDLQLNFEVKMLRILSKTPEMRLSIFLP
jgi:hypothetical protein